MFGLFESKEQKKAKQIANGFSAMTSGRFSEAEGCFLKAIEMDIFNAGDAWTGLGALYYSTGSYQKAKECFSSAIDQTHGDYHAVRGVALVERKLGNEAHAAEMFRQLQERFGYKPDEDPTLTQVDRDWLKECGF